MNNKLRKILKLINVLSRRFIRFLIFYPIDSLINVICPKSSFEFDNTVVFVKLDGIGDFVLWIESAKKFISYYEGKKFILICTKIVYEIAFYSELFDVVIPIDLIKFGNNIIYRIKTLKKIKAFNPLISIQPCYSRQLLIGDSLIRAINSKYKYGSEGDFTRISFLEKYLSNNWYTNIIPVSGKTLHEIERNNEFNSYFGISNNGVIKLANLNFRRKIENRVSISKPYFIIAPGGSHQEKNWSPENFAYLAKNISNNLNLKFIICGDNSDKAISTKIKELIDFPESLDFTGKTSILEYIGLIKKASFLIGNDSCAVHIAAMVGTPSFCLMKNIQYPGRFHPYPELKNGIKPYAFYLNNYPMEDEEVLSQSDISISNQILKLCVELC